MTPDEWLEGRFKERAVARNKDRVISNGIDGLWENLWAAVKRLLVAYTKGSPYESMEPSDFAPESVTATIRQGPLAILDGAPEPVAQGDRKLEITLDREKAGIRATYRNCRPGSPAMVEYLIGVNTQRQATFRYTGGGPIAIEELARKIADPFLFPDLKEETDN